MIAALLAAAGLAAAFAPPLDTIIRYRTDQLRLVRGGEVRIMLRQSLRITAEGGGYVAETVAGDHNATGPEPYRSLLGALFEPFTGVATRARLDRGGTILGAIDAATAWAATRHAKEAMLARMDAEPALTPQVKASAHAIIAAALDVPPEARDARIADAVAALLAPPLPALGVGESRTLTIVRPTPAGALPAAGTITLVTATPSELHYRSLTRTEPSATAPGVAALLATLTPGSTEAERTRTTIAAAELKDMAYVEETTLTVERATGLLVRTRTDRFVEAPDGARRGIEWDETIREP